MPDKRGHVSRRPANRAPATATREPAAVGVPEQVSGFLGEWAPTVAGILLGLVLAWFGYHELVRPAPWTGYVPVLNSSSDLAVFAVLVHGWILLVLAVALVAGIAPRIAAAIAAILLTEIVISLAVSNGLSDLVLRDIGVLGLAVCLTGCSRRRLVLSL
jgi:uncharacterized membrane protein YphA (DoxX/SURF4 family)